MANGWSERQYGVDARGHQVDLIRVAVTEDGEAALGFQLPSGKKILLLLTREDTDGLVEMLPEMAAEVRRLRVSRN